MTQRMYFATMDSTSGLQIVVVIHTPSTTSFIHAKTKNSGTSGNETTVVDKKIKKQQNKKYRKATVYTFLCYSFHDIGCYDLPAIIDYILEKTGHSKLYFIGHSQGAASFYVMGSEKPEYIAKIKGMISLAPVAFVGNQKSLLLRYISYWGNIIKVRFCIFRFLSYFSYNICTSYSSRMVF